MATKKRRGGRGKYCVIMRYGRGKGARTSRKCSASTAENFRWAQAKGGSPASVLFYRRKG